MTTEKVKPGLKRVTKPCPYPEFFRTPDPDQERQLREMEQAWLRWQATRQLNPFTKAETATGFEGYYVGLGFPPEKVAVEIAKLGWQTLESLRRLHRFEFSYLNKLWQVAAGKTYDHRALAELNSCLMANVAKLRVKVLPQINPVGYEFRDTVARLVEGEKLQYTDKKGSVVEHTLAVPAPQSSPAALQVGDGYFRQEQLDMGYKFMQLLGRSGYPLARLAIQR